MEQQKTATLAPGGLTWATWCRIDTAGRSASDKAKLEELAWKSVAFRDAVKQGSEPRWLVLLGPTGIGKTWIAQRLFRALTLRLGRGKCSWEPHEIFWPALEPRVTGKMAEIEMTRKLRDMRSWPILYLDDIYSSEDPWGDKSAALFSLLGDRVGKWTILTSNKTINDIQRQDPRMADRMLRGENVVWNCEQMESYSVLKKKRENLAGV